MLILPHFAFKNLLIYWLNAGANVLAMITQAILPSIFEQVKLSHTFFHQNTYALKRIFNVTRDQAEVIVSTCPSCQKFSPSPTIHLLEQESILGDSIACKHGKVTSLIIHLLGVLTIFVYLLIPFHFTCHFRLSPHWRSNC